MNKILLIVILAVIGVGAGIGIRYGIMQRSGEPPVPTNSSNPPPPAPQAASVVGLWKITKVSTFDFQNTHAWQDQPVLAPTFQEYLANGTTCVGYQNVPDLPCTRYADYRIENGFIYIDDPNTAGTPFRYAFEFSNTKLQLEVQGLQNNEWLPAIRYELERASRPVSFPTNAPQ